MSRSEVLEVRVTVDEQRVFTRLAIEHRLSVPALVRQWIGLALVGALVAVGRPERLGILLARTPPAAAPGGMRGDAPATKKLQIGVTADEKAGLAALAAQHRVSMSALVRVWCALADHDRLVTRKAADAPVIEGQLRLFEVPNLAHKTTPQECVTRVINSRETHSRRARLRPSAREKRAP